MPWRYELESASFINLETGDRLTPSEAEDLVDEIIERYQDNADDVINNTLDTEDPDAEEFEGWLSETIRELFIVLAILGGGTAIFQFLQGQIERQIGRQYLYLENFADQIYNRAVPVGSILNRVHMYLNSARSAYWITRDEVERRRGHTQEVWYVIGDEHTCESCVNAAMMGPQPIGTFGQPGSGVVTWGPLTMCYGLTACRCRKGYL